MNIDLAAKLKDYDSFIACYQQGDEARTYDGKSLLFYAVSNNEPDSRYRISTFLLDKGADPCGVNNCKENLLHILLSRGKHDLQQTTELCRRLVDSGVDINQIDERGRVPLQYLVNMKFTDEELEPLFQIFFSQPNLLVDHKNVLGKSPLELAELLPYRKSMVEHMRRYIWWPEKASSMDEILTLAQAIPLPKRDQDEIEENLSYDEWGLAFEVLCGSIEENALRPDAAVCGRIQAIGTALEMDSGLWDHIPGMNDI